jgi:hypothetical protein
LKETELLQKLALLDKQKEVALKSLRDIKRQMYDIETELMGINLQREKIHEDLQTLKLNKR